MSQMSHASHFEGQKQMLAYISRLTPGKAGARPGAGRVGSLRAVRPFMARPGTLRQR